MYTLLAPLGILGIFAVVAAIYIVLFSVGVHMDGQERVQGAPSSQPTHAPEDAVRRRAA